MIPCESFEVAGREPVTGRATLDVNGSHHCLVDRIQRKRRGRGRAQFRIGEI